MGRTMPTECPHGKVVDWGDFGDDWEPQACDACDARPYVWVSWSVDLDEVPNTLVKAGDDPYDRAIWERVALSEYYATREAWAEDGE